MPKSFDDCVSGGGRVRTISGPDKKMGLRKGQYIRVCFNDSGMHKGHVKRKSRAAAVGKGKRG
jgi:hypothetical protein